MANFRKQAFAQRLRDYMLEERGSFYKRAAAPIEYPQLQGEPGGMPPEQGMGMDPAMLEQIAAATGMDPQQLAQMPPEQLDQMMQEMQGGAPQEGGQEGQNGQAGAMPTLNITAKGDIAVETVNNMMGTQKMASWIPTLPGVMSKLAGQAGNIHIPGNNYNPEPPPQPVTTPGYPSMPPYNTMASRVIPAAPGPGPRQPRIQGGASSQSGLMAGQQQKNKTRKSKWGRNTYKDMRDDLLNS